MRFMHTPRDESLNHRGHGVSQGTANGSRTVVIYLQLPCQKIYVGTAATGCPLSAARFTPIKSPGDPRYTPAPSSPPASLHDRPAAWPHPAIVPTAPAPPPPSSRR